LQYGEEMKSLFLFLSACIFLQAQAPVPLVAPEQTFNNVVQIGVAVALPNQPGQMAFSPHGTGFFVRDDGLIATVAHVYLAAVTNIDDQRAGVLAARRFSTIERTRWVATPLDLVAVDYAHDVALLRLRAVDPLWQTVGGIVPLQREIGARPADNAHVAIRGYFGSDNFPIFLEGAVAGTADVGALAEQELLIVLPVAPGQSGSPVMSMATGRVVGVMTAIVPLVVPFNPQPLQSGLARAIEIEHINRLMDALPQ
jgi:S1-C subfamily serine protease